MSGTGWGRGLTWAMLVLASSGCAGRAPVEDLEPDRSCTPVSPPEVAARAPRVGVVGSVDPLHVPNPQTDAERLVFRQFYETLVRRTCNDALVPGLATGWERLSDDRWSLILRPGARFWDGSAVTVADVIAVLRAVHGDDAARAADDSTLVVRGLDPYALANPALAIFRRIPESDWPLGTGPLVRVEYAGADARDLLDRDVDMIVTDEPLVLEYAASRPEWEVHALPWSRTYVVGGPAAAALRQRNDLSEFARDVVDAPTRRATAPFWWEHARCNAGAVRVAPGGVEAVAYARTDRHARALAERVVAVLPDIVTSVPVDDVSADDRGPASYVMAVPTTPYDACAVARALGVTDAVMPLVDVRSHVVLRRGASGLRVEWDGVPRVLMGHR